jgi:serine/threonine protein kinase, bacterial
MPLGRGEIFAGYTIVRLLGAGGMGEVYLAQHPRLPRRDALKVLPTDVSADREFRERFNREADLAATLFHPHIVGVHDRGEFDEQLWISMDYIEGTDAAQLMRDHYPVGMPAGEVLNIVTAVAGALDYAHQRGLLHRDVKPANILLTDPDEGERRVFLSDFGIARQVGEVSGLTATNVTVATVPYAAPEQLMGVELDGRADQYALAATAFHLFTGAPPYQNSNPVAVISQHLTAAPPKLSSRRSDLARLDQVLLKALAKDPAERFTRCREFATALREQLGDDSIADRGTQSRIPVHVTPASPASVPAAIRRRRPRIILVAAAITVAVLTAAAGVIGYMLHQSKHATTSTPPAAVLDGTYRLDYNYAQQTMQGAPNPPDANQPQTETFWAAYRSICRPTGCVATGTELDKNNHQIAATPSGTSEYHFVEKRWQRVPIRDQVKYDQCSVAEGKQVPGSDTEVFTLSMEPQPDGTLRGIRTRTVVTSECGLQGSVSQTPFIATRVGDIAPGVAVADPATVAALPTISTSPPVLGPALNGTYSRDLDYPDATYNKQVEDDSPATTRGRDWWAFHSLCTPSGCIATGALLDDANHGQARTATVLQFVDGHWQDVPSHGRVPCWGERGGGKHPASTDEHWITSSQSLQPQPDGSLKGVMTLSRESNECGTQGLVSTIPFVATRVGDVAPTVVLADPALFMPPPAPASTTPHR